MQLLRQLGYTTFIINSQPSFHLWWKEHLKKYQKFSKYYDHDSLQSCHLFFIICLLVAPIVKSSHIFTGIYFIFFKKSPRPNSKALQYQIYTSMKRSKKQLSSKANFSSFLQVSCFNCWLKLCSRPYSYQNCEANQDWWDLGRVRSKDLVSERTVDKMFETNSSVHIK